MNTRPMIAMTLPMPPTLNHAYIDNPKGLKGRILSTDGKRYLRDAGLLAKATANSRGFTIAPGARLSVQAVLHMPDHRHYDLDNRLKILLDTISRALGFDDECIDDLHIMRGEVDKANPRAEVTISCRREPGKDEG